MASGPRHFLEAFYGPSSSDRPGLLSFVARRAHLFFPTDELSIFPADQVHGTGPFKRSPAVQETLVQLKHISICYVSCEFSALRVVRS